MEPSQLIGGTEECNSCESGWTMYIASPIHDVALAAAEDYGDNDDGGGGGDSDCDDSDDEGNGNNDDNDSDDSMASDASSGKNHRENLCKNADVSGNRSSEHHNKHEEDDGVGVMRFGSNPNEEEYCREEKEMRDEEGSIKREKESKSRVRSTAKASKINLKGKRK